MITVVHCKRAPFTHYVGRGSVFGNPFTHLPLASTKAVVQTATVEASVACFHEWARGVKRWRAVEPQRRLQMLKAIEALPPDAVLGCWCGEGRPCHGRIIKELREGGTNDK